jgi:hypothetical protein
MSKGVRLNHGSHRSVQDAAHVWDLSALCLGLGNGQLNFPASEYESGGPWAEEAHEARRVDINEFVSIWSNRPKQRALDGVLIVPEKQSLDVLLLMIIVPGQVVCLTLPQLGLQARWLASRPLIATSMDRRCLSSSKKGRP